MVLTVKYANPSVDRTPATVPTITAPYGVVIKLALAPMATPPARVAF